MIIGPVFSREAVTSPRRFRFYVARAAYPAALLILMSTAWLLLAGTQPVQNVGDFARFGVMLFQILAPLQLSLAVFFSALLAASAVAQEKDRRTLVLLLLTRLNNSELVLGKLLAGMLNVLVLLAAALPFFLLTILFGGVSLEQVAATFAVTLASALAAGSLGSTLALWREKTFQTLAMTALVLVCWIGFWEAVAWGALGGQWLGIETRSWAIACSPWQAILHATRVASEGHGLSAWLRGPLAAHLAVAAAIGLLLNGIALLRVRVWNPSREVQQVPDEDDSKESIWGAEYDLLREQATAASGEASASEAAMTHDAPRRFRPSRQVWDNPILWREIRTSAYGRKMLVIRLAYLVLFAGVAAVLWQLSGSEAGLTKLGVSAALVPLFLLSLMLVNALAVTSLTTERDGRALDLLLVTDLSPKEFVFGKLGGVFYNTKEMVLLPLLLCVALWLAPAGIRLENLFYLVGGLAVMYLFVAVLGIHCGISYSNSRSAIGTSIGTLFFLFVGVAVCMRMVVAFSGSFAVQLQPFLAFMLGGGVGLFVALGGRNPSTAIAVASLLCPFATFYAITSFLLDYTLTVFLVTVLMYGFATAAMLVPAIFEFDVATGRTTLDE